MAQQAAASSLSAPRIDLARTLAVVAALTLLLALALAFVKNDHSSYFTMVERDGSWLGYLPADGSLEVNVAGLDLEQSPQGEIRRVDLVDVEREQVVSLCFASSKAALQAGCPGFRFLGWTDRVVEHRVVGQLGNDSVDWLEQLGSATPRLADLDYLDE